MAVVRWWLGWLLIPLFPPSSIPLRSVTNSVMCATAKDRRNKAHYELAFRVYELAFREGAGKATLGSIQD